MNRLGKFLAVAGIAGLSSFALASTAQAVDLPNVGTTSTEEPRNDYYPWGGVYVGEFGAYVPTTETWAVGNQVGINVVVGQFFLGVEGQIGTTILSPSEIWAVGVNVRAGLLGTGALLYAEAGVTTTFPFTTDDLLFNAGGGIELAISERISVFGEAKAIFDGGYAGTVFQAGINFHLGQNARR